MKLNKDIRQRHFEQFEDEFNAWLKEHPNGEANFFGATVRAAHKTGWLLDIPADFDVGEMKPADVQKWALKIDKFYTEVKKIDPNS